MEAAELSETSCSPERPPKRMPTLSFFLLVIPEVMSDKVTNHPGGGRADLLSVYYFSALPGNSRASERRKLCATPFYTFLSLVTGHCS